jgi:hypothetical protein
LAEAHGVISNLKPHGGDLSFLLPQVVSFTASEEGAMSDFAKAAEIIYSGEPAASSLAHFAGDLNEVASHWKWDDSPDLTGWDRVQFDAEAAHFRQPPAGGEFRLLRYKNPITTTYRYWIWDGTRHCEVDSDWGRFWILSKLSYHVIYYDKSKCDLTVPKTIPLPKLLARAVVLCSGEVPNVSQSNSQAIYKNVPSTLATMISCKLGQDLNQF